MLSLVVIKIWLPLLIKQMQLPEARTEFPMWLVISIAAIGFVLLQSIMQWQVQKSMRLLPLQIAADNSETSYRLTKVKLFVVGIILTIAYLLFLSST